MDIISEFLGFDLNEVSEVSEQQKEQAGKIVKLIETDEWQMFDKFLKMLMDKLQKPVEFYAQNPNQAHYDSGYKRSLIDISLFIEKQQKLIQEYAKKQTEGK